MSCYDQLGPSPNDDDLFLRQPSETSPLPVKWNEEMDDFAMYHVYYPMWSPVGRSFQHVYRNLVAAFPSLKWGGGFYPAFENHVKTLVEVKQGGAPILQNIQLMNYPWMTEDKPLPSCWNEEHDHYILYYRYLVDEGTKHMNPHYAYEMLTRHSTSGADSTTLSILGSTSLLWRLNMGKLSKPPL